MDVSLFEIQILKSNYNAAICLRFESHSPMGLHEVK